MEIHLLHPVFVHFAVVMIVISLSFELFAIKTSNQKFVEIARWSLYISSLGAVFASVTGVIAENILDIPADVVTVTNNHEILGYITTTLILLALYWRISEKGELYKSMLGIYIGILILAVSTVIISTFLGLKLVFEYGIGIIN